jgi:hypothetical protein
MNSVAAKLITVVRENIRLAPKSSLIYDNQQSQFTKSNTSNEVVMLQVYSPHKTQSEFIETTYPDQSLLNTVHQKEIEFFSSEEKFSEVERYEQKLLNDNPELRKKMESALAAAFKTYGGDFTAMSAERERVFQEFFANLVKTTKSDDTNSDGSQEEFGNFLASLYRQDEDVSFRKV